MDHKIYFLSDIEMGRGDIMDDFSDDYMLADFIENITPPNNGHKATIVMLGDIFDFLKMPYKSRYPRYITKEISLWKTDEIIGSHKYVFKALKSFLENPLCNLHFVIGNHDPDLAWPAVQNRIKEALRTEKRITFSYTFQNKDIHAEHGHLLDPFFSINTKKPFIEYKNQKILNLPWGSYACFSHLVHLKRKFPKEECLYPNPLALELNEDYKKQANKTSIQLILKNLIMQPILHFYDPTYRAPYLKILQHALRYGMDVVNDEKFIKHRVKRTIKKYPHKKIYVMGHAHVLTGLEENGKKVFITDTWRDEYDLNNDNQKKPKSYVEIAYKNGKLEAANLKTFN